MFDGVAVAKKFKYKVLGQYVRALHKLDPGVATHILNSQREFFLAGKTFFEAEAGHAQKAIDKIQRRAGHKES